MKLIHSADWQLGCSFRGFGHQAAALRAQRLLTLRHTLDRARAERVDAFLIAGDLFEDNQVASSVLNEAMAVLADFPDIPVFILPGNHDAVSGPGCIWRRPPFAQPPPHVCVFREPACVPLGPGFLLASPLQQKRSTKDPAVRLAELAQTLPADALKIGLTHGSPAIESKYQPDDHPIHLRAATQAGLDYLALGHWHAWLALDDGRMIMPGTPEPDGFEQADGRFVARVEISGHGQPPTVQKIEVAGLTWKSYALDFLDADAARADLDRQWNGLPDPGRAVVRVTLKGAASRGPVRLAREWLEQRLAPFLAADVRDETTLALTPAELADMSQRHPLLAQVMADLAQLRTCATGQAFSMGDAAGPPAPDGHVTPSPACSHLSRAELQALLEEAGLDFPDLDEPLFKTAAALLADKLAEVPS